MDSFEGFGETRLPPKERTRELRLERVPLQNSWRLSRFVHGERRGPVGGCLQKLKKGMPGQIRAGPGALVQLAGPELGCALEKDGRRARAIDRPRHAPFHLTRPQSSLGF